MIFCKALNKDFETKQEMFRALKANKDLLIADKKKKVLESREKGISVKFTPLDVNKLTSTVKNRYDDDKFFYIVMNTTGILDSHMDLHVKGIWNKTAKERNRKNYIVDSHIMTLATTIARKEDVEILVDEIPFIAS